MNVDTAELGSTVSSFGVAAKMPLMGAGIVVEPRPAWEFRKLSLAPSVTRLYSASTAPLGLAFSRRKLTRREVTLAFVMVPGAPRAVRNPFAWVARVARVVVSGFSPVSKLMFAR